ncbi:MAG: aminotransferase class V-fold PLP-dependent enzyme [Actinomycetia bacterium]|nr:aminotransferase class V-fold PLP-dependent enzyme [Actinomycetes bacterium]
MRTSGLLDAAQGPLHPAARETLLAALDAGWADPRRLYAEARRARALLDQAREILATGIGVRPAELSLHASGEDALSTALSGVLHARRRHASTIVASAVEHSLVLTHQQHDTRPVPVDEHGRVDLEQWSHALRGEQVAVAALQHANGEVGTLQPLAEAYAMAQRSAIPLICDAQASLGRVLAPEHADVIVGSAASFAGPPAIGLLVVREGTRFGLPGRRRETEHGRADTDPWVPLALAAAEAWRQVEAQREEDAAAATAIIERLRSALSQIPGVEVVGHPTDRLPHILTASALYVDGETIVHELARRGLLVASGSACTASTLQPSHVLAAMEALSHGNVRITLPVAAIGTDRAADAGALVTHLAEIVTAARESVWGSVDPGPTTTTSTTSTTHPGPTSTSDTGTIDARGSLCPQPIIDLARWWRHHPQADSVRLLADDEAARADVPAWCRMTGRSLDEVSDLDEGGTAYVIGTGSQRD